MSRRFVAGSAPTGLTLMYAALCLLVIAFAALILVPQFPAQLGIQTVGQLLDALRMITLAITGCKLLFLIGGFLCVGLARQVPMGGMHYLSLVIWTVVMGVDGYLSSSNQAFLDVPRWLEPARFAMSLLAIAASLFFFRALVEETGQDDLKSRGRNTLQIGVFMIVFWVVYAVLPMVDLGAFVKFATYLSLGLLLGTVIAFVQYAKLLVAVRGYLTSPPPPTSPVE